MQDLIAALRELSKKGPLIHHISNMVTMNDCANICLAQGAFPIMALAEEEVEEITGQADVLLLNMGTFSPRNKKAMFLAASRAQKLGKKIIIDPVGLGASSYRLESFLELAQMVRFSIIRGNFGEIRSIYLGDRKEKGLDYRGDHSLEEKIFIAKELALSYQTVVAISGEVDLITDGRNLLKQEAGSPSLRRITGTGCMSTSLMAGFLSQKEAIEAAYLGSLLMGLAGEYAQDKVDKEQLGMGSYKLFLMDYISRLSGII